MTKKINKEDITFVDQTLVHLNRGHSVQLTKLSIKKGYTSSFKKGRSEKTILAANIEVGQPILLKEIAYYTTNVKAIFNKKGNKFLCIETETSFYSVKFL